MKHKWYNANKVNDLSTLTTTILSTYRRYISTLSPEVLTHSEQLSLETLILKELSSRTDLDPYARDAYRLALDYISQAYESTNNSFYDFKINNYNIQSILWDISM